MASRAQKYAAMVADGELSTFEKVRKWVGTLTSVLHYMFLMTCSLSSQAQKDTMQVAFYICPKPRL